MRKVRTISKLLEYLESIECPIGKSTISKLVRENKIPHIRISERVLIFDLDEIDKWLGGVPTEHQSMGVVSVTTTSTVSHVGEKSE